VKIAILKRFDLDYVLMQVREKLRVDDCLSDALLVEQFRIMLLNWHPKYFDGIVFDIKEEMTVQ
jgi:hypothetical protein